MKTIKIILASEKFKEHALELFLKALEIREKVLGKSHPSTVASYNRVRNITRRIKN